MPDADLSAADEAQRTTCTRTGISPILTRSRSRWRSSSICPTTTRTRHRPLPMLPAASRQRRGNLAANCSGITDDPDPLITSPLYGRWHALTQRVLFNSDGTTAPNSTNWVHRLNLDPRFRVPANYGAEIVEANAEAVYELCLAADRRCARGQSEHSPPALRHRRLSRACTAGTCSRLRPIPHACCR